MVAFFTRHPTAANLLLLLICLLGISALPTLQRETFPRFDSDFIQVQVAYPGGSTEDIEEAICRPLEEVIEGINNVREMTCEAREGVGIVRIEMAEGGDFSRFLDDVRSAVDGLDNLPDNAEIPVIRELNRTDHVISVAITGPMAATDLRSYAEQVKTQLKRDPQIALVEISGFAERQLRIAISEAALRSHGLSIRDVAQAVARQGIDLPAGLLQSSEQDYLLRFTELRRTPVELAELVIIGAASGGEIRLSDIATISSRFELEEEQTRFNGERAAILRILKTREQDSLRVRAAVERLVAQEQASAPPGVTLHLTQDRAAIVQDRLQLLTHNGVQGLILVFLVMWLFFQGRFAFWVAFGLPVSFFGALWLMSLFGLTINMITMVALLIAIGLLMDDAIVIAENIATKVQQGMAPYHAAIAGTLQVAPGVLSSFITSIAIFAPLAFLAGHLGKVLQFIPMVLILVLAVSLLEAFLILPHHLAHSLARAVPGERPLRGWLAQRRWEIRQRVGAWREGFDRRLLVFRDHSVGPAVDWAVANRYLFLGLVAAIFLSSLAMLVGGKLKFQIFPDLEGDAIEARLMLPQGTPLWRTEEVVNHLVTALEQVDREFTPLQEGNRPLVRNIQIRYNSNPDVSESGPHLATVSVDLLTAEERNGRLDDILQRWREEVGLLPDILSLTYKEPVIGPGGIALEMRLYGEDLEELKAASLALQAWFSRYPGVLDLADNLRPGKPELRLQLRPGALALGVDAAGVAEQVRAAYYHAKVIDVQLGSESFAIVVQLEEQDRASLSDLERLPILTANGQAIPLIAIAEIESGRGYSRIQRINGLRTVTVQGDLDTRIANAREIVDDTRANFLPQLLEQYPGVQVGIEGQAREAARTGGSMLRAFGIGLVFIFILLSFQFRSYSEPIVVMSIIPLALIGVIWGHLLMGMNLTMPGIIGFASLAGIVVNDSILLVTFLKQRVKEGMEPILAACQASRDRFRAILLTSITTIAGLTPLLLERSLQAQVLIPLAVSIIFGLLATSLLVLFVVPALYSVLYDLGLTTLKREESEREVW